MVEEVEGRVGSLSEVVAWRGDDRRTARDGGKRWVATALSAGEWRRSGGDNSSAGRCGRGTGAEGGGFYRARGPTGRGMHAKKGYGGAGDHGAAVE